MSSVGSGDFGGRLGDTFPITAFAEVSIVNGAGFYDSLGNINPVSLFGLVVAD